MGWCSATEIFDNMVEVILDETKSREDIITELVETLIFNDWDCEGSSKYWEHPTVRGIFIKLYPHLFEEE